MLETRLIVDLDALEALAALWANLWRRAPAATPFQSPAWLIPWMRIFAPGELRCAAAFVDGRLAALLPFYLEQGALGRRLMPIGVSLSDYLDVLVEPHGQEAAAAAVALLAETEWDEWRFEALQPDAEAFGLEAPADVEDSRFEQEACPVVPLRGGDLALSVPARQRRKQRRAWAAAQALGAVSIEADWAPEAFLDLIFALHRARWESRGEGGVLSDPAVQSFHRAALPGLRAAGLTRTHVLSVDGRAVGAYFGFLHRDRAYAYLGGFDPAYEAASPGALTIGAALQEAASDGCNEFHFLRGAESYKYAWGAEDRWNSARVWLRRRV